MSWKWTHATFPASAWTLVYTLVSSSAQIQITASASGSDHLVEVTSTTTGGYTAGDYTWQAHVSKDDERYKVGEGLLTVVPDFADQGSGYDSRSHVKKVLDALEAAIEGRASKTQLQHSVEGVSIQHMTHTELLDLRDRYAAKYRKELAALKGQSLERTTTARFAN